MGYMDLIKRMQNHAGLSDSESRKALDLMVESIAERLDTPERNEFAETLPEVLQPLALTALPIEETDTRDILHEFMEKEEVQEDYAKTQILAAWDSIKSLISDTQLSSHIRMLIPARVIATM